jgi:hypothetical protein
MLERACYWVLRLSMRPRRHRWLTRSEAARLLGAAIGDVWDHDHVTWKLARACDVNGGSSAVAIQLRDSPAASPVRWRKIDHTRTEQRRAAGPHEGWRAIPVHVGRRGFVPSATSHPRPFRWHAPASKGERAAAPQIVAHEKHRNYKCLKVWSEWQDSNVRSRTRLLRRIMLKDLCFWLRTQTIVLVRFWQ